MSAFVKIIIGVALVIGLGAAIFFTGGAALALLGTGLLNFLIAAGTSLILSGIGSLLSPNNNGVASATRNPVAPWSVIYGRAKVGGTIIYIEETGDTNKYLHMVIVLACHACEAIDEVYFDGQAVPFSNQTSIANPGQVIREIASISRAYDVVTVKLVSPFPLDVDGSILWIQSIGGDDNTRGMNGRYQVTQVDPFTLTYICGGDPATVISSGNIRTTFPNYGNNVYYETVLGNHTTTFPTLLAQSNGLWTAQHLLLGRTAVYLRLQYSVNVFPQGMPSISFLVRGKNDIFDPRSTSHGYSENPALIIADYLAHPTWGFKASYGSDIPLADLLTAANICDESVPLAAGGSELRYTCNGSFPLSTKRGEVIQNLLTSCGGRLTYSGGMFVIHPAGWPGVSLSIGDDPETPMDQPALEWLNVGLQESTTLTTKAIPAAPATLQSAWYTPEDVPLSTSGFFAGFGPGYGPDPFTGTGTFDLTKVAPPAPFDVHEISFALTAFPDYEIQPDTPGPDGLDYIRVIPHFGVWSFQGSVRISVVAGGVPVGTFDFNFGPFNGQQTGGGAGISQAFFMDPLSLLFVPALPLAGLKVSWEVLSFAQSGLTRSGFPGFRPTFTLIAPSPGSYLTSLGQISGFDAASNDPARIFPTRRNAYFYSGAAASLTFSKIIVSYLKLDPSRSSSDVITTYTASTLPNGSSSLAVTIQCAGVSYPVTVTQAAPTVAVTLQAPVTIAGNALAFTFDCSQDEVGTPTTSLSFSLS